MAKLINFGKVQGYQGLDVNTVARQLERLQSNYDRAREQELEARLKTQELFPYSEDLAAFEKKRQEVTQEAYDAYRKDFGSAPEAMRQSIAKMRAIPGVSEAKTQRQLIEDARQAEARGNIILNRDAIYGRLYDAEGNLRTNIPESVRSLNPSDLQKSGMLSGRAYSSQLPYKYKASKPGYFEQYTMDDNDARQFLTSGEGKDMVQSSVYQLVSPDIYNGLTDDTKEYLNNLASQSVYQGLVSERKLIADREFRTEEDLLDLEYKRRRNSAQRATGETTVEGTTLGTKPISMRSEGLDIYGDVVTENTKYPELTGEQRIYKRLIDSRKVTENKLKEAKAKWEELKNAPSREVESGTYAGIGYSGFKDLTARQIESAGKKVLELETELQNQNKLLNSDKYKDFKLPELEKSTTIKEGNIPEALKNTYDSLKSEIGDKNSIEYLQNTIKLANELVQPRAYYEKSPTKLTRMLKSTNTQFASAATKLQPLDDDYNADGDAINYKELVTDKDRGEIININLVPYSGKVLATDAKGNQYEVDRSSFGSNASNIARIAEETTNFFKIPVNTTKKINTDIGTMSNIYLKMDRNDNIKALKPSVYVTIEGNEYKVSYDNFMNYLSEQFFNELTPRK